VLARIERWRVLLLADSAGLNRFALRGLIGELLVLENRLLPLLGLDEGVAAWTGPLGMAQDFRLPSGQRIEVKAADRDADRVLVNGLGQLDGGGDPLQLVVVRLEDTGRDAPDALTVPLLIGRLRARLTDSPSALRSLTVCFASWAGMTPMKAAQSSCAWSIDAMVRNGLCSKKDWNRFRRSANHQEAIGRFSRHARSKAQPPPDPMSEHESCMFIRGLAGSWILSVLAGARKAP
jgi:Putative  PD-(D/E)XK family member, (DUF4420)